MGRKLKGAALRAHKRGKVAQEDIVDTIASKVETQHVEEQADNDQLFVIDTTGDAKAQVPPHLKQNKVQPKKKKQKSSLSALDQQRVDALVEQHDPETLQAMAKAGALRSTGNRSAVTRSQRKSFDLWGANDDNTTKVVVPKQTHETLVQKSGIKGDHVVQVSHSISKAPKDAVAIDVAHGGQSYRPDPKHYEKVVQDAVSLEVRRNKAEQYRKEPLSKGMTAETRALLVGDSDSEDEDEQDKEDETTNNEEVVIRKRKEKLTRAERNRQKRIRQERAVEQKQKQTKKLLNSVAELPRYKKELKKHQLELAERKIKVEHDKKVKRGTPGTKYFHKISQQDPIHAPTFPVALASEHKDASLRTMKPKGSLVTDRMASFVDRNLVSKRKMGDKKRIMQGKRRKLNVKGKGYEIAKEMDHKLMG